MPTTLTTNANEQSTYVITYTFKDETGATITPNSGLTWTLTDTKGNVVNSRSGVGITAASTVNIVLSGADLSVSSAYATKTRKLLITGTYNSSLGNNLPYKDEITFTVNDFAGV